jgi:hypothetical protein
MLRWLPSASLAVFFCLFAALSALIVPDPIPDVDLSLAAPAPDLTDARLAKLRWGTSYLLVIVALLWNMSVAIWLLRKGSPRIRFIRALLIIFMIAAFPIVMLLLGWTVGGDVASVIQAVVRQYGHFPIQWFTNAIVLVAFVAVVLIAVSLACMLDEPTGDVEAQIRQMRHMLHGTRISLYSASVLLVIGVAQIFSQYSWSAFFFVGSARDAFVTSAATLSAIAGASFTALLIILHVPVGIAHNAWIETIRSKQADEHLQLGDSTLSVLARALSISMPSLFGLIVDYVA